MQDCVHQQNDKTCENRKEEKEKKPQESDLTHSRMPNQAARLLQHKEQLRGSESMEQKVATSTGQGQTGGRTRPTACKRKFWDRSNRAAPGQVPEHFLLHCDGHRQGGQPHVGASFTESRDTLSCLRLCCTPLAGSCNCKWQISSTWCSAGSYGSSCGRIWGTAHIQVGTCVQRTARFIC